MQQDHRYITPEEMQQWFLQEIADSAKALELRIKEASGIVSAYASGRTTPEQADEQYWLYQHRWGEALPGTHTGTNLSDEQILASIDKATGKYSSRKRTEAKYKRQFGKTASNTDISR